MVSIGIILSFEINEMCPYILWGNTVDNFEANPKHGILIDAKYVVRDKIKLGEYLDDQP